jgi:exopolysaccharide production protein ExoZ
MIRPIQYLRGLATLMVVWIHAAYVIPAVAEQLGPPPFYFSAPVDIFFIISGFIMVVVTSRQAMTPLEFFRLRVVRIVPLYWLATLATIATALIASVRYPASAIAKSLLFVPYDAIAGRSGSVWPIVQQGWTLNYEMFFYALLALALAAPRPVRLPGLAVALGTLGVIGTVFGPFASPLAAVYTSPMLFDFAAGIILAYCWLRDGSRDWLPQSVILAAFGFIAIVAVNSRFVSMCAAFIIVAGCLHPKICAIQNRPLMELGDASYSIYLIHQLVLEALARAWLRVSPIMTWSSSALFTALSLVLCSVAGILCYRFVERPLTSQLRKFAEWSSSALRCAFAADSSVSRASRTGET